MARSNIEDLTAALQSTQVSLCGVSFEGKSLKLDTAEDSKEVILAIEKCNNLQFLNLEGNTLGVEAAKVIAKALEKHPEFKHALWKDMFTGRMKEEIPIALEHLGAGLVAAGAKLTKLDMSDNAFGPIGVKGLAALLKSASCYALQELRLNNNGLGITGGKMLASALTDCYNYSKAEGKPLTLKVFIAGRNRLENEGAKALSAVFKIIGTLEEIAMPQNGIYHPGISALSEAFTHNKNLRILNLNDNTIGPKGAEAIAQALPNLTQLQVINFGDCLLKTKGAICLAEALTKGQNDLEELIFDHNEIGSKGIEILAKAVENKTKLKNLMLDGNNFGSKGVDILRKKIQDMGRANALGSLSEVESEEEEEDEDAEESEEEEEDEHDSEENNEEEESTEHVQTTEVPITVLPMQNKQIVTVADFVKVPTTDNFLSLGSNRCDALVNEIKNYPSSTYVEDSVTLLMKISSLSLNNQQDVAKSALACSEAMYKELFSWVNASKQYSILNNSLLVHLGLIKGEDRKYKPTWNVEGCLLALENVVKTNSIPTEVKDTLKAFMDKDEKLTQVQNSLINLFNNQFSI